MHLTLLPPPNAIKYSEILLGEAVTPYSSVCGLGHLACVLGYFKDQRYYNFGRSWISIWDFLANTHRYLAEFFIRNEGIPIVRFCFPNTFPRDGTLKGNPEIATVESYNYVITPVSCTVNAEVWDLHPGLVRCIGTSRILANCHYSKPPAAYYDLLYV